MKQLFSFRRLIQRGLKKINRIIPKTLNLNKKTAAKKFKENNLKDIKGATKVFGKYLINNNLSIEKVIHNLDKSLKILN